MASRKNPFGKAHFEKMALTKTTEKRIRALYSSTAKEIQQRLDTLQLINPSDSLRKAYLESLQRDVNKSIDSLNRRVEQTIKDSGEMSGNIAVNAGNRMMQEVGLTISGAYSYVPRQEVENIVSGNLYGRGWNLSQAIWKSGSKVKSDVENIVAKGLIENKPIKAIADDLMTHVDPTARKPWDWNKVYPGTAAKVDYNAQRLARTMIQHSFQQSLVQSQRYNPFCRGIIWWSVGLHGRTCAECLDRDGQLFSPATLPLDHPNGLCYFEPQLVPMDQIADELADWTMGAENAAIDRYITKGLELNKSTPEAKKAIDSVKRNYTRRKLRTKEKSKGHKVVNGKDISATWTRRSSKFDFEIEDVINAQGFDGKPRIVSAKEFDAAVKDSKFIAQRTYSAESQEILDAYRKQLYEGKWYVDCSAGGAQYGQGMYCAADYTGTLSEGIKAEMRHYAGIGQARSGGNALTELVNKYKIEALYDKNGGLVDRAVAEQISKMSDKEFVKRFSSRWPELKKVNNAVSYTETLTLDPSAKIIKYDDLIKLFQKEYGLETFPTPSSWRAAVSTSYNLSNGAGAFQKLTKAEQNELIRDAISKSSIPTDAGSYAALKGYDAINAVGHGESGSYTIILNRTKVIIKKP